MKRVAGVLSVVVAALVVALLISWEDLLTQYYLYRLERDPDLLNEMVVQPEGAPMREATSLFARRPIGQRAVLRQFLAATIDEIVQDGAHGATLGKMEKALLGMDEEHVWLHVKTPEYTSDSASKLDAWEEARPRSSSVALLRGLNGLLGHLAGHRFALEEYPRIRIEVLPPREAYTASGLYKGTAIPQTDPICYFERLMDG